MLLLEGEGREDEREVRSTSLWSRINERIVRGAEQGWEVEE
jgi:hypothetical protein